MRLLLSTSCLPDASPDDLLRARHRHGFAGFEVDIRPEQLTAGVRCPIHAGDAEPMEGVAWYRVPEEMPEHLLMLWAAQAHAAGAGLIVRDIPADPLGVPTAIECSATGRSCECGPAQQFAIEPCWNISATDLPDREQLQVLLAYEATRPVHIRLAGAGPEAANIEQEALGLKIGAFFGDLAVLGYRGTLALAPSSESKLDLWRRWLLEERGWGCGTAAEKQRRRLQQQAI